MPRYFFDVCDGVAIPDEQGHECADLDAAKKVAATYAGELLQAAPQRLWRDGDWTVSVRDEQNTQLFSIVILGLLGATEPDETIDISCKSNSKAHPEPFLVIGSGGASRRRDSRNE